MEHSRYDKIPRKQALTTIALILMLTITALITGAQTLNVAGQSFQQPTYAFIVASPNPVGLGQQVLVNFWIADPLPTANVGLGQFRSGYKVTITKPDNTTEVKTKFVLQGGLGGKDVNYLGGAYFVYFPAAIGEYTFKFDYPGEVIYVNLPNGANNWNATTDKPVNPNYNYTALPSTYTYKLTVQTEKVADVFKVPLPTEYWTRPIYGQNYWWSEVSSNWLMRGYNMTGRAFDQNGVFVPEGTVPKSAHVLWTKPYSFGGLAGGIYNNVEFYSGMSYEMYDQPQIIIGDRMYIATIQGGEPRSVDAGPVDSNEYSMGTMAIDLNTGETLFVIENVSISFGQILNFVGPNQAGTHAYLWSTPFGPGGWTMYDAWTGNKIVSIANVTTGTTTFGPKGEIINYALSYNSSFYGPGQGSFQVVKWNSSKALKSPQPIGTGTTGQDFSWRPFTNFTFGTVDGNNGIEWRKPAVNITGYSFGGNGQSQGPFWGVGREILAVRNRTTAGTPDLNSKQGLDFAAYDMDTGALKWQSQVLPPAGRPNPFHGIGSFGLIWGFNGHMYAFDHYTMQWVAYDIKSGQLMWITEPYTNPYGYYGQASSQMEAYGYFMAAGFDGFLHGYNLTTGVEEFSFSPGSAGELNPYGIHTFYNGITVADGKAILLPNEHGSAIEPLYQNLTTFVVDVRDNPGQVTWGILGYFEHPALADGKLFSHNNYDNALYAFGKGPSSTTIAASPKVSVNGGSVLIEGTVLDISPGTKRLEQDLRFPHGVPAISDASQSKWMEYVYMQQPVPMDATGVPVSLIAIDPNGNPQNIGTVTSDASGQYAIAWTPPVPGLYKVIATFAGSESYWPSYAETALNVDAAPSPAPAVTPTPIVTPTTTPTAIPTSPSPSTVVPPGGISATDLYLIGIALVVVIVVVAAAVILKRRK